MSDADRGRVAVRWFMAALVIYFVLQVVLRVQAPNLLDIDEAEQVVLCQWFDWGYGHQPPLYTWIQAGMFSLLGHSVLALSVLKNLLLFLTYVFVYFAGRLVLQDRRRAMLATACIALIPQVSWEAQRDLTHTVLMTCMSAACVMCLAFVLRRPRWWTYALFGLTIGLGMLSKYNFAVLAVCLVIGSLGVPAERAALLRPGVVLSIAVAAVVVLPHMRWLATHTHMLESIADELGTERSIAMPSRMLKLGIAIASCVLPMLIGFGALFHRSWRAQPTSQPLISSRAYLLGALGLAIAIVALANLPHVKARWIAHLALVLPLLLFTHADPRLIGRREVGWLYSISATIGFAVLLAMTMRVLETRQASAAGLEGNPFRTAADQITQRTGFVSGVIASNEPFYVGNLKFQRPEWIGLITTSALERKILDDATQHDLLLVWDSEEFHRMPPALAALGSKWSDVPLQQWEIRRIELPLNRNGAESTSLCVVVLPPRRAANVI